MSKLSELAARLDGPGIADYELDMGISHEAAAALREAEQVLRECEEIVLFTGDPQDLPLSDRIRALIE